MFVDHIYTVSQYLSDNNCLYLQLPGVKTIESDISDWNATRRVVEELGDIHLLVNNAAIHGGAAWEDALHASPELFDRYGILRFTIVCQFVTS